MYILYTIEPFSVFCFLFIYIKCFHSIVFVIYLKDNLIGTLLAIFGNLLVSISVSIQVSVCVPEPVIQGQGVFRLHPVMWMSDTFIYLISSCFITWLLFIAVSTRMGLTKRCKRQMYVITDIFFHRNKVMWRWLEIKTRGNITTLKPGGWA